ncbi:TetR-like C-terminal domain-containing protein [Streptomyces avermitilis]|uniref:TetR-like C-terminal domain-containing protein n=1 Tax=Streptomyces avermitilis TaxID=33903 RepID=UPI003F541F3C
MADETHAVRMLGSVFHGYVSLEMDGGLPHRRRLAGTLDLDLGLIDALLRNRPLP